MSKDLISRSELLGRIYEMQKFNILDSVDEAEIIALIANMPVAYDPDKVLERLEDYLFERYCAEGTDKKLIDIVLSGYADMDTMVEDTDFSIYEIHTPHNGSKMSHKATILSAKAYNELPE